MAALPIGTYDPKWKYGYGNVTPEQAVQIHQDVLAMCSLAVSWGTFTLSNEVSFTYTNPCCYFSATIFSLFKMIWFFFFYLKIGS